ncbi:MAG: mitochondrial fission ELM1 family protein, partial [Roseobacter sp.]
MYRLSRSGAIRYNRAGDHRQAWAPGHVNSGKSDSAPAFRDGQSAPLVWVLAGHRHGDNVQLQALAEALGWPYVEKRLVWRAPLPRWTPLYGRAATLKFLTDDSRAALRAPWPDVVLSIGWRSVPVARWIKDRTGAKLVHLGRPRAPLHVFDLILTTPQYRMPEAENVLHLAGPVTTLSADELSVASKRWESRLHHLPRPWIAVLVGGDTPTLKFPLEAACVLGEACNGIAMAENGSLLIATSPRTSKAVIAKLKAAIKAPAFIFEWREETDNPYLAFLALADRFVVTNDSVSMTHEAALTGRPLEIFRLSERKNRLHEALRWFDRYMQSGNNVGARFYRNLIRAGLVYPAKTPDDYFETLLCSGRAAALGAPRTAPDKTARLSETER